jgi:hypothetical protein
VAAFRQARYDEEEQRIRPQSGWRNACGAAGRCDDPRHTGTELHTKRCLVAAAVAALEQDGGEVTGRAFALHVLDLLILPYLEDSRRRHPSGYRHGRRPDSDDAARASVDAGAAGNVVPLQRGATHRDRPRR